MERFAAWVVAAAILLKSHGDIHYIRLAERVVETRLTGLGNTGADPPKTLRAEMGKHSEVFMHGNGRDGYYDLLDPAKAESDPKIARALKAIEGPHSSGDPVKEIERLNRELLSVGAQKDALERRLTEIAAIASLVP